MTTSIPEIKPWQIRLAYVRFSDNPEKGKVRPVLILKTDKESIEALKITTNGKVPYPIIDLSGFELDLRKPSWLQLSPTFAVRRTDIGPLLASAPISLRAKVFCRIG